VGIAHHNLAPQPPSIGGVVLLLPPELGDKGGKSELGDKGGKSELGEMINTFESVTDRNYE